MKIGNLIELRLEQEKVQIWVSRALEYVPMSGAVAIGIIAAASQLAAYSIKIVLQLDDFCAEVRSTPIRTRQHLNQVKELIETANLIGQHKSLQLPAVNAKLQSTLFEAQLLYGILKEASARYTANSVWRHWAVLRGVDEQKILTSLNKLEREKSALKLCITIVHTDLLLGIQGSIDKVSTRRMAEKSGQGSPTSELIVSSYFAYRPFRIKSNRKCR